MAVLAIAAVLIAALIGAWLMTDLRERSSAKGTIVFAADRWPAFFGDIYSVTFDGKRTNLTHSNYDEMDPLLSPDGKWVAFESKKPGYSAVFVVRVDGRGLTQISPKLGPEADSYFGSWSPDSKRLAVCESNSTATKLYILQARHKPRVITRVNSQFIDAFIPSWSPSGRSIAFEVSGGELEGIEGIEVRVVTPTGKLVFSKFIRESRLYSQPIWSATGRLALQDGPQIVVYSEQGKALDSFSGLAFAWSPDGRRLASVRGGWLEVHNANGDRIINRKRVYSSEAVTKGMKENDYFPELLWLGNGRVGVSVNMNIGAPDFVGKYTGDHIAVDIPSGRIRSVGERLWAAWQPCDFGNSFCSSPDRSYVAESARYRGGDFYLRIARLDSTKVRTVRKLVRVPGCWSDSSVMEAAVSSVQLSTKSRSIVYQSYCVQPYSDLYLISPDGSDLRRLTRAKTFLDEPQWSPDGQKIALTRSDGVGISQNGCPEMVWMMNANGRRLHRLTPESDVSGCDADWSPSWSPDGRRIVYSHSVVDEKSQLRIVSATGGKPRDLHVVGASPAWGAKRIAYVGKDSSVWTLNPDGGDRRRIASMTSKRSTPSSLAWSPDGRLAWLESTEEGAPTIAVLGDTVRRFPLPLVFFSSDLTWSPDGRTLAFTASAPEQHFADVYTIGTDGKHLRRLTDGMNASGVSWR